MIMVDGRFLLLLLFGAALLSQLPRYFRWENKQFARQLERDLGLVEDDDWEVDDGRR